MTDPNYTHIVLIVDRSGSMQDIAKDAEGGIKSFLKEQAKTGKKLGQKTTVTLAQFDTEYEVVYEKVPVDDVPTYHLIPRGSTALLDAIGRTITSEGQKLAALPESLRPGSVYVVINTDGYENASCEYRKPGIKALIEKQTNQYGWNFVYLGANQDAVLIGGGYGIPVASSLSYKASSAGVGASYNSLGNTMSGARAFAAAGGSATLDFAEDDRLAAVK
jgi:hypothetical protein